MPFKQFIIFIFFTNTIILFSQTNNIDSLKQNLPFAISHEKKLPADELAEKREGVYLTGIPDISYDPLNGLGYGGEASLFFNGKKTILFLNILLTEHK